MLHRRNEECLLDAVRRSVARSSSDGIPAADHLHAARRRRDKPARCRMAIAGRSGRRIMGPSKPAARGHGTNATQTVLGSFMSANDN